MLKFIPLGGVGEVTKNMFLYETDREILVIDCGAGLPDDNSEDKIFIPDFSFLRRSRKKIQGVVVSHAHFDHYGALPFLLSEFDLPVFGSRLTLAFLGEKLKELKIKKKINLQILRPKKKLVLGSFSVTPFHVNHSVPEAFGFAISTPAGKIFHVSDYKFDFTPVHGPVFDFHTCLRLANRGVLALFSDCLGACESGFTQSEKAIEATLFSLIAQSQKQVFVTTLSSNLSRIRQIINAARRAKRKVVVLGRSLETSLKIGQKLGFLPKDKVLRKKAADERKVVYLVAGSYGQANGSLMRIAQGKYPRVSLKEGALVIFSADPSPPNTRDKVDKLVDLLTLRGAEVHYYEIQENLHVSGHGSQSDIQLLFALIKPQFFIPLGGCPRHMRAYSLLAQAMGVARERVFELLPGETLQLKKSRLQRAEKLPLKEVEVLV